MVTHWKSVHGVYDLVTHVDQAVGIHCGYFCAVVFVDRIWQCNFFADTVTGGIDQVVYDPAVNNFVDDLTGAFLACATWILPSTRFFQ
jgi:hypothetical protein